MKYLKILGLVALAAAALAALVGASASATVLCKAEENPCSEANEYPKGTSADGSLGESSAIFTDTSGKTVLVTCTGGTVKGELEFPGSKTETPRGKGTAENVKWTGCSTTMHTIAGGEVEIHHIAGTHDGTVVLKSFKTTLNVLGVSCVYGYGAGTDIGVLRGGPKPTLEINAVLNEEEPKKFLCPDTAKGQATGILTEPAELPVYVEPE